MKKAIVTAGPTREKIDPVRYISNYSSGKQGYAIADELVEKGYDVILISGPVAIEAPAGVTLIDVESAQQMLESVERNLPADVAVFTAAVCDWRADSISEQKMKKTKGQESLQLNLVKNPDILKNICASPMRPRYVIGFAAETENMVDNAQEKLKAKGCDIIIANDVSRNVFGEDENEAVALFQDGHVEKIGRMSKTQIAHRVISLIDKLK